MDQENQSMCFVLSTNVKLRLKRTQHIKNSKFEDSHCFKNRKYDTKHLQKYVTILKSEFGSY